MSQFTFPPTYHFRPRASALSRENTILSPPDTESSGHANRPRPNSMPSAYDPYVPTPHLPVDTPVQDLRRPSSISYHQAKMQDVHAGSSSSMHWLVVVIPPASLGAHPGSSSDSASPRPGRSSQGILMPLFPTLYGQLSAIAREFGFPSTTGICIYLQIAEGDQWFTPRVSRGSWQILWSKFFAPDGRTSQSLHQLPVSGRIEFDIDTHKAKWFVDWQTRRIRNMSLDASSVPLPPHEFSPHSTPEGAGSPANEEAQIEFDVLGSPSKSSKTPHQSLKKLTLLERRTADAPFTKSLAFDEVSFSSRTAKLPSSRVLPIQEDQEPEPKSGRSKQIDTLVQQWRETSATPLHTSNTRNPSPRPHSEEITDSRLSLDAGDASSTAKLNLDDYTWSISSRGPPSDLPSPGPDSVRSPSIHILDRMRGSVILTPSVCTSFGPPDDWPRSPALSTVSPYPSPDIAARMIEDAPVTPSTATSWGPPSSYYLAPASPYSQTLSPDIAARMVEDSPVTPSTATSWGPPSSYPATPVSPYSRVASPDIASRMMEDGEWVRPGVVFDLVWPFIPSAFESKQEDVVFDLVWPFIPSAFDGVQSTTSVAQSASGVIFDLVWPFIPSAFDGAQPATNIAQSASGVVFDLVWPFIPSAFESKQKGVIFDLVWPFIPSAFDVIQPTPSADTQSISVTLSSRYPNINIYPAVYPYFDIYPASHTAIVKAPEPASLSVVPVLRSLYVYPNICPYPPVPSTISSAPVRDSANTLSPSLSSSHSTASAKVSVDRSGYPWFEIYPAVRMGASWAPTDRSGYPYFDLYPLVKPSQATSSISDRSGYPFFELYPAVKVPQGLRVSARADRSGYPFFDLYPAVSIPRGSDTRPRQDRSGYPFFDIYPAIPSADRSAYPFFDLYPSINTSRGLDSPAPYVKPQNELPAAPFSRPSSFEASSPSTGFEASSTRDPVSVALPSHYPNLVIYAPVYPFIQPYPSVTLSNTEPPHPAIRRPLTPARARSGTIMRKPKALVLRPTVLVREAPLPPLKSPVPRVGGSRRQWRQRGDSPPVPPLPANFAALSPLPSKRGLYPDLVIYPAVSVSEAMSRGDNDNGMKHEHMIDAPSSPTSSYSPVSENDLTLVEEEMSEGRSLELPVSLPCAGYPVLNLYPAVYPYFDIYPAMPVALGVDSPREPKVMSGALLPHSLQVGDNVNEKLPVDTAPAAGYPSFNLYPPVDSLLGGDAVEIKFDDLDSAESTTPAQSPTSETSQKRSLAVLHDLIFGKSSPEIPQFVERSEFEDEDDSIDESTVDEVDNELQVKMARWNFPGTLVDDSLSPALTSRPGSWIPPPNVLSPRSSDGEESSFLAERSLRRSRASSEVLVVPPTPGGENYQDVLAKFPFPPAPTAGALAFEIPGSFRSTPIGY